MQKCLGCNREDIQEFVDLIEAYRAFWGGGQGKIQTEPAVLPRFLEDIGSKAKPPKSPEVKATKPKAPKKKVEVVEVERIVEKPIIKEVVDAKAPEPKVKSQ